VRLTGVVAYLSESRVVCVGWRMAMRGGAVFANLDGWKIGVLLLVGIFILGPERLPKVIGDATRLLRTVRQMARNATDELSRELGTQVSVEDLHPKTFVRKHLLSEEDEASLRRPFDDAVEISRRIAETPVAPRPTAGPPPAPASPSVNGTRTNPANNDAT
jgi:sec-independent protein translocase protein TatB